MKKNYIQLIYVLVLLLGFPVLAVAKDYMPIVLDDSYNHDKFGTVVTGTAGSDNHVRKFRAYTTVFDGADDDNGDGTVDLLGVPHFVAYEMKKYEGTLPTGPKRPSPWLTDKELYKAGIAPSDATYKHSKAFLSTRPNWYVRGHLCMKQHAWRLGANADWNTHTTLNAVPQRQNFNAGIWLDLEYKTAEWADKYGSVWIVDGPIFEPQKNTPNAWLGEPEKGEMLIAIPDALFKIVVRETDDPKHPEVLAFIYPQTVARQKNYDHTPYLTSVDVIEEKTGLDLLTVLPNSIEDKIESEVATSIWE